MTYKNLGKSNLKVSELCMGTMTFGDGADYTICREMYALCRDRGINFFDCANVYAEGESEVILGKLISEHREEVIITTKAYYPTGSGINDRGLGKIHLTLELEKSLKRLNTDYIDVFYLHSFDVDTPLEESLSTINGFIKSGKVRCLGVSNFAAWQIMKALGIANIREFNTITCIQPMYNLLKRQCESEILPMAESEGLSVVPYGPLAGGMLTGKYLGGDNKYGRLNESEMYKDRYKDKSNNEIVHDYISFSRENNFNPIALAIAWVKSHKAITSPIIGARNVEQLKTALKVLDLNINEELRQVISSLSITPAIATDRSEEEL